MTCLWEIYWKESCCTLSTANALSIMLRWDESRNSRSSTAWDWTHERVTGSAKQNPQSRASAVAPCDSNSGKNDDRRGTDCAIRKRHFVPQRIPPCRSCADGARLPTPISAPRGPGQILRGFEALCYSERHADSLPRA